MSYAQRLASAEEIAKYNFLAALGPLRKYLEDDAVYNVNINEDGRIFVEHAQIGTFEALETMSLPDREALIGNLANREQRSIDRLNSRLQCDMPYFNVRCQAFAPPISTWSLMLRKHAVRVFTLCDYVEKSQMTTAQRWQVEQAVSRHENIFVVGGMNSGKSTALNAVLHECARRYPSDRLLVVQDRKELQPTHRNVVYLMTVKEQAYHEGGTVHRWEYSWLHALEDMLRTSSDAYVFGELREYKSAVGLVMAANTGASGIMATMHANSAEEAPERLEDMLAAAGVSVPTRMAKRLLNTVIEMGFVEGKRVVKKVLNY
jgi:Flp pilus assembly CpaF family ATPase